MNYLFNAYCHNVVSAWSGAVWADGGAWIPSMASRSPTAKYSYSTNTYTQLALGNLAYESTSALDTTRKLWIFFGTDNNNNVRVPTVRVIDLSPGSNYEVQDWTNRVTGCGPLAGAQYPGVAL